MAASSSTISSLNAASTGKSSSLTKSSGVGDLGQTEFMTLLIAQLKNQDPESPVDSKEFAVQLAQFTQVEQLTKINQKLGDANGLSSMASYLGREVVLDGSSVGVTKGAGGKISVDLPKGAADLKVDFLDSNGEVVGSKSFGAVEAGKQSVALNGLSVPDGNYSIKVTAVTAEGTTFAPDVSISGVVTGVLPGADPKLIVDGQEVSVSAIKELRVAGTATGAPATA